MAAILLGGLQGVPLDEDRRPLAFFFTLVHDIGPYLGHFEEGRVAEHFGDHGCLFQLGGKGPLTRSDCPLRRWNNGASWCVEAGYPCAGCSRREFPHAA